MLTSEPTNVTRTIQELRSATVSESFQSQELAYSLLLDPIDDAGALGNNGADDNGAQLQSNRRSAAAVRQLVSTYDLRNCENVLAQPDE